MIDEELRARAVALRREGLSRRQIRERLGLGSNGALGPLLEGEPPPEWTRRPNAKDDVRAKARELRKAGRTYDEIVAELGVSKSSVSLWVRDLPKPRRSAEEMRQMSEARWGPYRGARELRRQEVRLTAQNEIGQLTDRELFLVGVGLYWSEGAKDKPHGRTAARVSFINSDPDMIRLFLAWLRLLKVDKERLRFTVNIHESADVAAAERYWAEIAQANPAQFGKTCLKKHNPKTVRKNVGADYRGCLTIRVLGSTDLYRRIEGWWAGIVVGGDRAGER